MQGCFTVGFRAGGHHALSEFGEYVLGSGSLGSDFTLLGAEESCSVSEGIMFWGLQGTEVIQGLEDIDVTPVGRIRVYQGSGCYRPEHGGETSSTCSLCLLVLLAANLRPAWPGESHSPYGFQCGGEVHETSHDCQRLRTPEPYALYNVVQISRNQQRYNAGCKNSACPEARFRMLRLVGFRFRTHGFKGLGLKGFRL